MTHGSSLPVLSRGQDRSVPPVRLVHLGLGNFFRAHQAWYTDRAPDAQEWGIAAFTGRRPDMAEALAPQDGLYTLVTRHADEDAMHVVGSVVAVHTADEHESWLDYLRSPEVAVVTLTVTEAGYLRSSDGGLDAENHDVRADVAALQADPTAAVRTTPGRLVAGLLARRSAAAGRITVLPCDNLPENGAAAATVVGELAELVRPGLRAQLEEVATYATSMVDRITPRATTEVHEAVRKATGYADASPVATEPFSEWVISGEFPAGRPRWEQAGAQLVPDVAPFEQRKLWLLNGSHSLLAYAGSVRGHETVAEAITDPTCRSWVQQWWDEASRYLSLPADDVARYREALVQRFENPRIRHLLAQIAADGSQKLPVRILPTVRAERAAGRVPAGAALVIAAWVLHLRGHGAPVSDTSAERLQAVVEGPLDGAVRAVLGFLDDGLDRDEDLVREVLHSARELGGA
ncbi:MAG TPA: mannitol dehydrogenase family protein [Jiangellaceae bacterium]|nr:mannitol dehydrogenase family protein [Jiangellaceae bacterium]